MINGISNVGLIVGKYVVGTITSTYATVYDFGDKRGHAIDWGDEDRTSFEARIATSDELSSRWNLVAGVFYNEIDSKPTAFVSNSLGR